jgi:hypothetical protein
MPENSALLQKAAGEVAPDQLIIETLVELYMISTGR